MIYSTGDELVATDGHRLHHYKPEVCPLSEGYYQIKKRTKTVLELLKADGTHLQDYPDFKRIMPDRTEAISFPTKCRGGKQICVEGKFAETIRTMGGGALSYGFFKDANTVEMPSYLATDGFSPVLLCGLDVTAVIMPINYLGTEAL